MESGRWTDGRFEPFGPVSDLDADAPTLEQEAAGDAAPPPAGELDAPTDIRSHELAPAGAVSAVEEPAGDELEPAGARRRADAVLRLTAAVMLPLSVVAIATATTVLVGEDPAPLSAEAAPGILDWSAGPDGLPALPFTPRGLPTLPFAPVPSGQPAAEAATQPERATPRDAPAARTTAARTTAARTTAGARRIPAPAVVNAPRRTTSAPAPGRPPAATGQGTVSNGGVAPGPVRGGPTNIAPAAEADPSAFDVSDTPTVTQEPAPQQPVRQEPVRQEPVRQEPVQQEPVQQEPVQQEPVQQEPVQQEPVQQEPVQ